MNASKAEKKWYALYTKSRHEKKVTERLVSQGFDVFCPMIKTLKQWSDRKKKVTVPLIPSYIFVNIEEKNRTKVLSDLSVLNFVFWLGKPAVIKNNEIHRLKGLISREEIQEFEIRHLNVGDKINIDKGFLKENDAVIKKRTKNHIYAELKELGIMVIMKKTDVRI
ncbi:UpxY family transcription antiterminator [Flavobacteriales bacterium]|nr:UpxY family transcription antiterminator [Flavobacteriales bacterium]